MIKLLIFGPLPEEAVEVEYLEAETRHVYYSDLPKYTHKYGDYYERTVERVPNYSWEEWLSEGEQHELIPEDEDSAIYVRYFRDQGHFLTFNTPEELLGYLETENAIEIKRYKLVDGTTVFGISPYYD